MKKTIGILGGCLLTGLHGVCGLNDLFYRRLQKRLAEDGHVLRVEIATFGDFPHPDYVAPSAGIEALSEVSQKVDIFIGRGVDAIVIALRPSLHWAMCKPVSSYKNQLYIHPLLNGGGEPIGGYWPARIMNKIYDCVFRLSGGRIAFYQYADDLLTKSLLMMHSACALRGIQLFVISNNDFYKGLYYGNHMQNLYKKLKAGSLSDVIWIDPKITSDELCNDDFHINANGHRVIADKLHSKFLEVLFR